MRKLYKNELRGTELVKASEGIKSFNQRYGTNIFQLTEDTDWYTWKCETRNWLKVVRRVIKLKDKACKEATIKRRIEERNNMITTDQGKMINSILDKTYSRINLDRIRIATDTQEEILLNSKEEVQAEAINAFSSIFCSRNHKFENLPEQWRDIYEPRADIDLQVYDHLDDMLTEQEWNEMLNTMNDKSAPGISNISYKLIKKAGAEVNELFRRYTGLCYYLQDIPVKWKISQLYPIPKTYDWDYNLARMRPILLIECLRKCAVKIITKRLGSILSRHAILKGPNYAGLPGESTSTPLTIINSKLKNLWRNQIAAQITEFLVALNSQTKQADMLKMRLKKAQLTLNIMSCILTIDPDVTVSNKMLNNHAYNVARKAHDYLFKFHPLTESEEWNIPIISSNVRDFIYQQAPELQKKDKELIIRKAAALSVHGILQLLNYDASNTVTWQQICDFNRRQARGRTLKWFDTLLGLVQQSPQLKDLCKISVESSNSESESGMDRGISINIQAIKMTKKVPSIDGRKKEFVYTQQDHTLVIGQIDKKGRSGRYTMQHWAINADNQRDDNGVIIIQRCSGCALNDKRVNKGGHGCYFNRNRPDLACINRISSCQNTPNTKSIKDILEIRNHLERQYIPERIPGFIQIYDYDTALIQNTLSNKEAVIQHIALLHHLRSIFNSSDMINIYTDSSLTTRFNANLNTFTKHMGTGWVILNDKEEVILECSSSITEWPLSTRAELGAILSAILVLQTRQRVNIFTDSQAAIDSINHTRINLTNGKNRIRVWCKSNNHSIVSSIINLVDSKHLELKLTKVKGHSGVKGNEEADRVAKNDTERLTCITINDSQQMDLKYDVYWNGKRVDRHIRKFIDNI
ncbi:hypothetical protein RhiirB3_394622, partial [Rhizophagus irregularis]